MSSQIGYEDLRIKGEVFLTFYTYTPVLIIGLASSVISGILGISKQKKYARYASLIAIICIAILFYVSHGIDVYYDKRFYDSVISLQILGSPEIFNEWVWRLASYGAAYPRSEAFLGGDISAKNRIASFGSRGSPVVEG